MAETTDTVGTDSSPQALPHRAVLILLVPLMLVLFISNLDQTIVATALGTIGSDLGNPHNAPWIATAYLLTSAVTTLLFGKLGDMYGRKRIFQISVAIFLIGSILCGMARNMMWLIVFRALQGIGGGGLNSLVMAIIGDVVPPRQRSKYQAYTGIVAMLALIAGPLLGGIFTDALSWRWIFYLNIPIGVIALITIATSLHLPARRSGGRIDVLGAVLVTVFTTAVLLLTSWGGQKFGWGSPAIIGLAVLSVAAVAGYLFAEHRAAEPITPLHLFRSSIFNISSAQFAISTLVLFVGMLYVPLFLQQVQHRSAFTAGLFLIPQLLGLVVATAIAGPVIAKTGRYKMYPIIGSVLSGVGMTIIATFTATTPAWLIIAALVLVGAGVGLGIQVALLAGQNAIDYRCLGVATGALNFFKSIGGAFGAALFGAILTATLAGATGLAHLEHAFHIVFAAGVPFTIIGLVLAIIMREKPLSEEMIEVAEGKVEVPEY